GFGAPALEQKPSQRQRSPAFDTSRWPGDSCRISRSPSPGSTSAMKARRAASSGGALIWPASGAAPSGQVGAGTPAPTQRVGAFGSSAAERSSPNAAASAASRPASEAALAAALGDDL